MSPADSPTPTPVDLTPARWNAVLTAVFHVLTGGWRETSDEDLAAPGVVPADVATAGRLTEIRVTSVEVDDPAASGWWWSWRVRPSPPSTGAFRRPSTLACPWLPDWDTALARRKPVW